MRAWLLIIGGLIVWAAHFIAAYAAASVFPGQPAAHLIALAATTIAVGANAAILRFSIKPHGDQTDAWVRRLSKSVVGISTVAIIFQTAPAIHW